MVSQYVNNKYMHKRTQSAVCYNTGDPTAKYKLQWVADFSSYAQAFSSPFFLDNEKVIVHKRFHCFIASIMVFVRDLTKATYTSLVLSVFL